MPIIKSAKKAARQAVKRTAHNNQIKKSIKAALKAFKAKPTAENLSKAQSEYDKAAKKSYPLLISFIIFNTVPRLEWEQGDIFINFGLHDVK